MLTTGRNYVIKSIENKNRGSNHLNYDAASTLKQSKFYCSSRRENSLHQTSSNFCSSKNIFYRQKDGQQQSLMFMNSRDSGGSTARNPKKSIIAVNDQEEQKEI